MNAHPSRQHILVTGASSGIGLAIARAWQEAGASVIGLDRNAPAAGLQGLEVDLADAQAIQGGVTEAAHRLGQRVDVLVNCAGIMIEETLDALTCDALDLTLAVNVRAPFLVTRSALPFMGEGGCILNIASELAYLGRAGASAYCATKGAILSMTRSWARELAPRIRVNAIAPGPIDTPLLNFAEQDPLKQNQDLSNPMGRIGRPDEIARVALFLASADASFITGQCLNVDGGAAMH
ncbi:SDR family NAD(P)-dependent oxidoreductase [Acetobacter conturbans]|uniref:SDR family oxidoreductase n=1 Tax=Acetobacter conturbans TaxID=1737472 RepID=A0ABX0K1M8_9PROT|nr:SDR family oxidoreductase [Acetobacter conturbans]NHN89531.1 SDR family oxidoreductase [Acetobacter conturbans]